VPVRSTPLQQNFACATNDPQQAIAGLSGRTKIVKHISAANSSGSSRSLRLYLNGTTSAEKLLQVDIAAGGVTQLTGLFIVVLEADAIYADQNGAGVTFSAFGANLLGDPE